MPVLWISLKRLLVLATMVCLMEFMTIIFHGTVPEIGWRQNMLMVSYIHEYNRLIVSHSTIIQVCRRAGISWYFKRGKLILLAEHLLMSEIWPIRSFPGWKSIQIPAGLQTPINIPIDVLFYYYWRTIRISIFVIYSLVYFFYEIIENIRARKNKPWLCYHTGRLCDLKLDFLYKLI